MLRLAYLLVLLFCVLGTLPLEFLLRTRVYARPRRLALAVLPVALVFLAWDVLAIRAGHWDFDPAQTTGVVVLLGVPLEELLFFLVVPTCAVLTLEAVRAVRGWRADRPDGWRVGDEPA